MAVVRGSCTDDQRALRLSRQIQPHQIASQPLSIDGFNVLTTIEVALGGGVILAARDAACRDIASVHGTYRKVEETRPAVELTLQSLKALRPLHTTLYLDSPVGNSGRLAALITQIAGEHHFPVDVRLIPNPDKVLIACSDVVATADSLILDTAARWFNLARYIIDQIEARVVKVPMSS